MLTKIVLALLAVLVLLVVFVVSFDYFYDNRSVASNSDIVSTSAPIQPPITDDTDLTPKCGVFGSPWFVTKENNEKSYVYDFNKNVVCTDSNGWTRYSIPDPDAGADLSLDGLPQINSVQTDPNIFTTLVPPPDQNIFNEDMCKVACLRYNGCLGYVFQIGGENANGCQLLTKVLPKFLPVVKATANTFNTVGFISDKIQEDPSPGYLSCSNNGGVVVSGPESSDQEVECNMLASSYAEDSAFGSSANQNYQPYIRLSGGYSTDLSIVSDATYQVSQLFPISNITSKACFDESTCANLCGAVMTKASHSNPNPKNIRTYYLYKYIDDGNQQCPTKAQCSCGYLYNMTVRNPTMSVISKYNGTLSQYTSLGISAGDCSDSLGLPPNNQCIFGKIVPNN